MAYSITYQTNPQATCPCGHVPEAHTTLTDADATPSCYLCGGCCITPEKLNHNEEMVKEK